jgi:tetrahydromethanopterin S-methyltransferase subunit C
MEEMMKIGMRSIESAMTISPATLSGAGFASAATAMQGLVETGSSAALANRQVRAVDRAYSSWSGLGALVRKCLFLGPGRGRRAEVEQRKKLRQEFKGKAVRTDHIRRTAVATSYLGTGVSVGSVGNSAAKAALTLTRHLASANTLGNLVAPIIGLVSSPLSVITESIRLSRQVPILRQANRVLEALDSADEALLGFRILVGSSLEERADKLKTLSVALSDDEAEALMLIAAKVDLVEAGLTLLPEGAEYAQNRMELKHRLLELVAKGAALAKTAAKEHIRSSGIQVLVNLASIGLLIAGFLCPPSLVLTVVALAITAIGAMDSVQRAIRDRALRLGELIELEEKQSTQTSEPERVDRSTQTEPTESELAKQMRWQQEDSRLAELEEQAG